MQKQISVFVFILVLYSINYKASAQLFNQKQTQKKYLLQQIAALQQYIGYVKKGYSVAKNGFNTISDIKKGEFKLHEEFFNSLKEVNPKIANYARVAVITALQVKIVQTYKKAYRQAQASNVFNSDEISYIHRVYERVLSDCAANIIDLINVTTNNKLEMKDDERLKRVDILYFDMQDKYTFVKSFGNETGMIAASREKEKHNIKTSRLLNGIKID